MRDLQFVLSCEHAKNVVPRHYKELFGHAPEVLSTHRGYDIGALKLAQALAKSLDAPLRSGGVTRLLVDLNRELNSHTLFSSFVKVLSASAREEILHNYYFPYRNEIATMISKYVQQGKQVIHLSIHSFTPIIDEKLRLTDLGFLYDPSRFNEKNFCVNIIKRFRMFSPLRARCNYPYLGISDSLTTSLRAHFSPAQYLGIQIEMNQRFGFMQAKQWRHEILAPLLQAIHI